MKKKANGTYRARINARGFEQEDGFHYKSDETVMPVINETTIKVLLVTMTIAIWAATLIYVQGAFLNGQLNEELYMHVPEGFKKYYGENFFKVKAYNLRLSVISNSGLEGTIDSFKIDDTEYIMFLNEAVISKKSKMQESVSLSVTEVELIAATSFIQDIIFIF